MASATFGEQVFVSTDGYSIDCVAHSNNILVCGQSRKDGNNWDGRVTLVSTETSASIDKTVVSGVSAVASSNSSGNVFVGRDDGNLSIYSDSLDEVTTISAHDDIITAVSVNPFNDAQCVTVCWDGKIGLLDCDTDQIDVFYGHSGIINGVTHNRKQPGVFSTIGQDGFLRLWDSRSASEGCTNLLPLCQIGSTCCWSSQSEFLIACGLEDGGLVVADIRTNNLVSRSTSHSGRITKIVCPNSSNKFNDNVDEFFISSSVDKSICTQKFENIESDCFRIQSDQCYATDITWVEELAGRSVLMASMSDGCVRVIEDKLLFSH